MLGGLFFFRSGGGAGQCCHSVWRLFLSLKLPSSSRSMLFGKLPWVYCARRGAFLLARRWRFFAFCALFDRLLPPNYRLLPPNHCLLGAYYRLVGANEVREGFSSLPSCLKTSYFQPIRSRDRVRRMFCSCGLFLFTDFRRPGVNI